MSATVYSSIGPLLTRDDIELGMLTHVQTWLVTYLAEVERQKGLAPRTIATPKSWEVVNEYTRYPEEQMPFVAVISPGRAPSKPLIDGDGQVTAWWNLALGAIVATRDEKSAKVLAGYYGAAMRGLVMQMPMLGGWASGVEWTEERYDDFPRVTERTMAAVRLGFTVEVESVLSIYTAPRDPSTFQPKPPADPYAPPTDYPTVSAPGQYTIDIQNQGGS